MPRHVLRIQSVQKQWKMICKMQHNDGVVNVPVVMHWLFPTKKKNLKPESLRKLCEEPDCMCSENGVVWAQTPINVVSSPLPSFLLSFLFFVTSLLKKYPFRFLTFSLHFLKKILLLMFYFSLLKMFCP